MVTYSSDLFLDIFCVYTQSSDAMGLIFHAKLTVCFISYIYWFHPFKKMSTSFKNRMCNGMPSFIRKICFTHKNTDGEQTTIISEKKVVGAARFSFHIC